MENAERLVLQKFWDFIVKKNWKFWVFIEKKLSYGFHWKKTESCGLFLRKIRNVGFLLKNLPPWEQNEYTIKAIGHHIGFYTYSTHLVHQWTWKIPLTWANIAWQPPCPPHQVPHMRGPQIVGINAPYSYPFLLFPPQFIQIIHSQWNVEMSSEITSLCTRHFFPEEKYISAAVKIHPNPTVSKCIH